MAATLNSEQLKGIFAGYVTRRLIYRGVLIIPGSFAKSQMRISKNMMVVNWQVSKGLSHYVGIL